MSVRDTFATNMRRFRKSAGMTQEDLAEKSGLHRTYIGGIEQQRINVSLENINKIAEALNIAPALLFLQNQGAASMDTSQMNTDTNKSRRYALCAIEDGEFSMHALDIEDLSLTTHILCTLIQEGYEGQDLVNRYKKTQLELIRFFDEHPDLV